MIPLVRVVTGRLLRPTSAANLFRNNGSTAIPLLSITVMAAVSIGIGCSANSSTLLLSTTNSDNDESTQIDQVHDELGYSAYHTAIGNNGVFNSISHTKCEVDASTDMSRHPVDDMSKSTDTDTTDSRISKSKSRIIFLGSGSSTGCPRPLCPLVFSESNDTDFDSTISPNLRKLRTEMRDQCRTSVLASVGNPIDNKDYRNNPSLLISIADPTSSATTGQQKNIIIDVGKTFREGAIRWLPKYGIRSIDAIVLTHQHMDAAAGLDDVRGVQRYEMDPGTNKRYAIPMPLYLSDICLPSLQDQFPWLLPKPKSNNRLEPQQSADQTPVVTRHVASFDVTVFEPFQSFEPIPGFSIVPLPLIHGEDLISYGFAFTLGGGDGTMNVVYLSDISRMLPETLDYIQNTLPQPIHVLILDSLLIDSSNPVHYCLPQSMELVQQLNPIQTYLVGMNCDSFGPHDETNAKLQKEYGSVKLAYDGLVIDAPSVGLTDEGK